MICRVTRGRGTDRHIIRFARKSIADRIKEYEKGRHHGDIHVSAFFLRFPDAGVLAYLSYTRSPATYVARTGTSFSAKGSVSKGSAPSTTKSA